jgi:retinol dehydrogenase 12
VNAIRRWFVHPRYARRCRLDGRRIIVTGAAPGSIGYATARNLAGADVVVTTRGEPQALAARLREALAGSAGHGRIDAHALDLADADSVERFAAWHTGTHDGLDVLVNNAGIHLDLLSRWQQPRLSEDGHEIHWRTNYLGTMHLTLRLLPQLLRSAAAQRDARIVNVVSQLHAKGTNAGLFAGAQPYDSWVAYGNSKLALVHATFELQQRYGRNQGLRAYCLHPGAVFTHIADRGLEGSGAIGKLREFFSPVEAFFLLTPEEGAQTSLHCATDAHAQGGHYYRNCGVAAPSRDCHDTAVAARLWERTSAWAATLSISTALAERKETAHAPH